MMVCSNASEQVSRGATRKYCLSQKVHFTIEVALCVEQTVLKGSAIRYFVGHLSHIRMILRTSAIVGRPEVLLVLAR